MRLAFLFLALLSLPAWGQELARLFGKPVGAAELKLTDEKSLAPAASVLRQHALKEAMQRFIVQYRLQASAEDLAAYEKFDAEFQRRDQMRRAEQKRRIETELQSAGLEPAKRQALEKQREVLVSLEKFEPERASMQGVGESRRRVLGPWIESYKARKALYDRYGGAVAITKWGPDPVGASASLLREYEKLGEIRIMDPALAAEFWKLVDAPPRFAASRPEHFDFTYYWLKPVGEIK